MARKFKFARRAKSGTQKKSRGAKRKYVVGYRGGRPSYGTMARNAWPFRKRRRITRRGKGSKGGATFTSSRVTLRKKPTRTNKLLAKLVADHTVLASGAFSVEATGGVQAVHDVIFQRGTATTASQNNGTTIANEFAIYGTGGGPESFILKKGTNLFLQIANAANTCCHVDIYDFVCCEDMPEQGTAPARGPKECFKVAIDKNYVGGAATDYLQPYTKIPFGSTTLSDNWTVKKRSSISLNPGQMHNHRFTRATNKKIHNNQILDNNLIEYPLSTGGIEMVSGWTYAVMVILNGYPASVVDQPTQVGFGPAKINCIWKHSSRFCRIADNTKGRAWNTNTADPPYTGTTRMVNDDDGAVSTYAKA